MGSTSGTVSANATGGLGAGPTEVPRRLVVELTSNSAQDLGELMELEEQNKTTLVNRAIQVYKIFQSIERSGGKIFVQEAGSNEVQRVRIV